MAGRLFRDKTREEHADSLSHFLPSGKVFLTSRMPVTRLRGLLLGLAEELYRVENTLNTITYEHQIDQTTLLIEEWEKALGIPDDCLKGGGTIEERRRLVLIKLTALSAQSVEDFIRIAGLFGFEIEVIPGACRGIFPIDCGFPLIFYQYPQDARFDWIVIFKRITDPCVFELPFPVCFSTTGYNLMICLFNKLKPANTHILYEWEEQFTEEFHI